MDKIRLDDYKRMKEYLELTGLNEKQVSFLLRQISYAATNAVHDAGAKL